MVNDENVAGKGHAHSSSRKSPALMEKPSVMHRKYMPTTASATLIHSFRRMRCPVKIRRKGTMMIYSAVIIQAFPTVVYCMPYCCRLPGQKQHAATAHAADQQRSFRHLPLFLPLRLRRQVVHQKDAGDKHQPPRTLLAKRKAKGPT